MLRDGGVTKFRKRLLRNGGRANWCTCTFVCIMYVQSIWRTWDLVWCNRVSILPDSVTFSFLMLTPRLPCPVWRLTKGNITCRELRPVNARHVPHNRLDFCNRVRNQNDANNRWLENRLNLPWWKKPPLHSWTGLKPDKFSFDGEGTKGYTATWQPLAASALAATAANTGNS